MHKACDSQAPVFDFTPVERANARSAFEEILSQKEERCALFMLHQWLLSRYHALNGSPIDSQARAVFDFTPQEHANARPAFEDTFAESEETQHV